MVLGSGKLVGCFGGGIDILIVVIWSFQKWLFFLYPSSVFLQVCVCDWLNFVFFLLWGSVQRLWWSVAVLVFVGLCWFLCILGHPTFLSEPGWNEERGKQEQESGDIGAHSGIRTRYRCVFVLYYCTEFWFTVFLLYYTVLYFDVLVKYCTVFYITLYLYFDVLLL